MFEDEAHTETELNSGSDSERGSPSLVGRGIANPMSERTRGFELPISSPTGEGGGTKFPLPALLMLLFSVKDANGNPVQGKITLTDNNTTIRFNPVPTFNRNSRYTVTITKGIMDISGASLAADMEWHFTTLV